MTIEIEGQTFTPFPADQEEKFKLISYHGRVAWLEFRFNVLFMYPLRKCLELEGQCYVWLCILSLATLAIDSLAKFEYTCKAAFVRFVEEFFPSGAFKERNLRLHDPRPDRRTKVANSPAQHLYEFFRSSIAHDFCINWGELLHLEDGAPSYLFEVIPEPTSTKDVSLKARLGIPPRDSVKDFQSGVSMFFAMLRTRKADSPEAVRFDKTFRRIFYRTT